MSRYEAILTVDWLNVNVWNEMKINPVFVCLDKQNKRHEMKSKYEKLFRIIIVRNLKLMHTVYVNVKAAQKDILRLFYLLAQFSFNISAIKPA